MRLKFIVIISTPFLSGCLDNSPAVDFPRPWLGNQILSKTHTEAFFFKADRKVYVSNMGKDFDEFLRNAKISSPGLVVVTLNSNIMDDAQIWSAISESGIQEISKVEVLQAAPNNEQSPDLNLELTYFAYKLTNCGSITNPRKIDSTNLVSPGFGCSVERNRLLSLSYPPDWQQGRQSTPSYAIRDGQAVQFLFETAPRSFPPANK
ncbi:MAG: hypothetical protein V7701_15260 [Sneathiella sp.]